MAGGDDGDPIPEFELPDGAEESDTDRDGLLSYSGEWHALTIGVYRGLTTLKPWDDSVPRDRYEDVREEPWYYKGGFVLGTAAQAALVIAGAGVAA